MYKEHKEFNTPEDDKKIWRYMDFSKFVDIIDRKKIFFPTVDRLGDPFEGSFPKAYIDYFNANLDKIFMQGTWQLINREQAPKSFARARKTARKFVAISCWNMQEEQSAALWKIYGGIAIQSTIRRLKDSFKDETRDVHIGKVKYIDHYSQPLSDSLSDDFFPNPFLYKGKSFKFEKEARAVIDFPPIVLENGEIRPRRIKGGYSATIDPDILIEKVYLSPVPKSSKWLKKVIESVLAEYGLKKKVLLSDLNKKPLF